MIKTASKQEPTISRIFDYVNGICADGSTRLAEVYGTESFCWFLHSLILIRKPKTIVELGTGAACTTSLAAFATKLNRWGHVWSVDDGSEWEMIRNDCERITGSENSRQTYQEFLSQLFAWFDISDHVTPIYKTVSPLNYFAPEEPIDILYIDLGDTGPLGCLSTLQYYLPRMARSSSMFIDRVSTIMPARLLLASIFECLNRGRVPHSLIKELSPATVESIKALAQSSRFTLMDLVEPRQGKLNSTQNSRLWINIEVDDFLPPEGVDCFMG